MGSRATLTTSRTGLDGTGELAAVRALLAVILGAVLLCTPALDQAAAVVCFKVLAAHLLSSAALLLVPRRVLRSGWLLPAVFLADLALISWAIAFAAHAETDLYLIYFLVILMSGMQRDDRLSFLIGGTASVLYGFIWSKTHPLEDLFTLQMLLRFPFFFIVAFFSAHFARRAREDEAELREAREQLAHDEKLASVGRLAAGMANEFNNIVMKIDGNIALLEESFPADDGRRQDTRAILQLNEKAAHLAGLLLNFSRRQAVSPTMIDFRVFMLEKAAALRKILGEGVEDRLELAPDLPHLLMDRDQLWQLISCLAANAREAMGNRGIFRIGVEGVRRRELPSGLRLSESSYYIHLTIADNGRGIPPELVARLFEPFVTTKPAGKGTGMGLASSYGIVQRAGGDLRVRSAPGQGTSFHVYIPAQTAVLKLRPGTRCF